MIGHKPSAGQSLVAQKLGPYGELGVVLAVNLTAGGIVPTLVRLFTKGWGR